MRRERERGQASSGTLPPQPPMASHGPQGPTPTVLEGQELKDTVDDGHDDGESQQVGVGL